MKVQPVVAFVKTIESYSENRESDGQTGDGRPPGQASNVRRESYTGAGASYGEVACSLTERERKIIVLVGRALSNKVIADRLCIISITVRHHLTSIFDKLGVTTRQKLLIRAHQYKLVELRAFALPL